MSNDNLCRHYEEFLIKRMGIEPITIHIHSEHVIFATRRPHLPWIPPLIAPEILHGILHSQEELHLLLSSIQAACKSSKCLNVFKTILEKLVIT